MGRVFVQDAQQCVPCAHTGRDYKHGFEKAQVVNAAKPTAMHTGRDFIQPCMKSRPVRDSLLGEMGRVPASRSRTYCWELSDEALLLEALPEDAALLLEALSDEALPSVDSLSADSLAAALYWAASSSYFFWYLAMSRS